MKLIPTVRLTRLEENKQGTLGVLTICSQVFCVTLELPDRLNVSNMSSIPAQQYECKKIISPHFGETFEIYDVPSRSHVLFHSGNVVGNTRGCILLGQYFGKLQGDRAILNSGITFNRFMALMKDITSFNLTIKESY